MALPAKTALAIVTADIKYDLGRWGPTFMGGRKGIYDTYDFCSVCDVHGMHDVHGGHDV